MIITQNSGCETVSSTFSFDVIGYPQGSLSTTPSSCGNDEGTITVTFADHPMATGIMISLDGGINYFPSISDALGMITYTDLVPAIYAVWAQWDGGECAVFIDSMKWPNWHAVQYAVLLLTITYNRFRM